MNQRAKAMLKSDFEVHLPSFLQVHNTLDPLLEALTRDYVDDDDLSFRLQSLFKACSRIPSHQFSIRGHRVYPAGLPFWWHRGSK